MQEARGSQYAIRNPQSTILNRGESGQALILALLALTLGILLVAGFMYFASTSQLATKAAREQATDRYSSDAGVEHALWRLTNEITFTESLTSGSPATYTITLNGQTVVITVTRVLTP
jgi:hypothetical protein